MKAYSAYLFDLDGTLIDTLELILECFRHTLKKLTGLEVEDRQILSNVGLPLRQQYEILWNSLGIPADTEEAVDSHMSYQLDRWRQTVKTKPGALETLAALGARGAKTGIVTSRRYESACLYTAELGILRHVQVLCCPEQTHRHKPDPEPARWSLTQLRVPANQALFVGDSPYDIQCGQSAGCDTCLISSDSEKVSWLVPKPTFCIGRLMELLPEER